MTRRRRPISQIRDLLCGEHRVNFVSVSFGNCSHLFGKAARLLRKEYLLHAEELDCLERLALWKKIRWRLVSPFRWALDQD